MGSTPSLTEGTPMPVEREELPVMYLETADEPAAIRTAWHELEGRIGALRGRRFVGAFDGDRYRTAVAVRDGDDPAALGLSSGTLPGGRYLRMRLRGEPEAVYARIPSAMARLEARADRDDTRPCLEHYRRFDEVDLLVPIRGA